MILSTEIPYFTPENHPYFPNNSNSIQTPNFTRVLNNFPNYNFPTHSTSLSNTSTSDEAVDHDVQLRLINERKHRRMISNRESARRSRMRKKSRLDELCKLVVHLRSENFDLLEKLNHMTESYDNIIEENMRLKEETCELRQWLTDVRIGSPHNFALKDTISQLEISSNTPQFE